MKDVIEILDTAINKLKSHTYRIETPFIEYVSKGINMYFRVQCHFKEVYTEYYLDVNEFEVWFKSEYPTLFNDCKSVIELDETSVIDFDVELFQDLNDWKEYVEEYLEIRINS